MGEVRVEMNPELILCSDLDVVVEKIRKYYFIDPTCMNGLKNSLGHLQTEHTVFVELFRILTVSRFWDKKDYQITRNLWVPIDGFLLRSADEQYAQWLDLQMQSYMQKTAELFYYTSENLFSSDQCVKDFLKQIYDYYLNELHKRLQSLQATHSEELHHWIAQETLHKVIDQLAIDRFEIDYSADILKNYKKLAQQGSIQIGFYDLESGLWQEQLIFDGGSFSLEAQYSHELVSFNRAIAQETFRFLKSLQDRYQYIEFDSVQKSLSLLISYTYPLEKDLSFVQRFLNTVTMTLVQEKIGAYIQKRQESLIATLGQFDTHPQIIDVNEMNLQIVNDCNTLAYQMKSLVMSQESASFWEKNSQLFDISFFQKFCENSIRCYRNSVIFSFNRLFDLCLKKNGAPKLNDWLKQEKLLQHYGRLGFEDVIEIRERIFNASTEARALSEKFAVLAVTQPIIPFLFDIEKVASVFAEEDQQEIINLFWSQYPDKKLQWSAWPHEASRIHQQFLHEWGPLLSDSMMIQKLIQLIDHKSAILKNLQDAHLRDSIVYRYYFDRDQTVFEQGQKLFVRLKENFSKGKYWSVACLNMDDLDLLKKVIKEMDVMQVDFNQLNQLLEKFEKSKINYLKKNGKILKKNKIFEKMSQLKLADLIQAGLISGTLNIQHYVNTCTIAIERFARKDLILSHLDKTICSDDVRYPYLVSLMGSQRTEESLLMIHYFLLSPKTYLEIEVQLENLRRKHQAITNFAQKIRACPTTTDDIHDDLVVSLETLHEKWESKKFAHPYLHFLKIYLNQFKEAQRLEDQYEALNVYEIALEALINQLINQKRCYMNPALVKTLMLDGMYQQLDQVPQLLEESSFDRIEESIVGNPGRLWIPSRQSDQENLERNLESTLVPK